MVSQADAAALRRAFPPRPSAVSADGKSELKVEGDALVLRRSGKTKVVEKAPEGGAILSPGISADGSEIAYIRKMPDRGNELKVAPSSWWALLNNGGSSTIWAVSPIVAAALSPDGNHVAWATRTDVASRDVRSGGFHIDGTLPPRTGPPKALCWLDGGRVAIETKLGTLLLMETDGSIHPLPWTEFSEPATVDSKLDPRTQKTLQASFGPLMTRVLPSPDGRRALATLQDGQHVVVDRERLHPLGKGKPDSPAAWSPDGRFVACDLDAGPTVALGDEHRKLPASTRGIQFVGDGYTVQMASGEQVRLKTLFPAWEVDMGAHRDPAGPGVEEDAQDVHINGVKIS